MKRLTPSALLLATMAMQPMLAMADHENEERNGRFVYGPLEWRLGPSAGREGHEIYFRHPRDHQWHRAPGSARVVADGWVIGTDRVDGGYGIYRWNGRNWQHMPGAAIRIGGTYANPWVVNDRGERFSWNGFDWREQGAYLERNNHEQAVRARPAPRRQEYRDHDRDDVPDGLYEHNR